MFAMFGASVLVPFVFGINPAIVLFMNGVGTLLFILITKGKAPAYLGSSFAFLAPAGIVITKFGYEYALGSFVAVGFCGCILALLILQVRIGLDRRGTASGCNGTGRRFDWTGIIRYGGKQCGTSGGKDPAGKCDRIFCDVGSCGIWFDHVSEVSVRYPDPDRRDRRICGSAGVWNC